MTNEEIAREFDGRFHEEDEGLLLEVIHLARLVEAKLWLPLVEVGDNPSARKASARIRELKGQVDDR